MRRIIEVLAAPMARKARYLFCTSAFMAVMLVISATLAGAQGY